METLSWSRRRILRAGTMPVVSRSLAGFAATVAATLAAARPAGAESWPARPVRFIVPFPPGGPVDAVGRAVAHRLSELWGQQALVDNRAGAGGIIGAEVASQAAPDGYTVFVCSIHHSVLPSLKPKLPYDIRRSFVPISFGARFPIVLVANPALAVRTVPELVELARRRELAYASAGNGGGTHLAAELFNMMAGTKLLHVPFKGSAPAMTDVLAGHVPLMFADGPTALPQVRTGKVLALGVGNPKRSDLLPDVPTIAEQGLPGYDAYSWAGFVAPAGTPKPIVERLSADIGRALTDPAVRQRLHESGAEAAPTRPAEFGAMLDDELRKWARVVKAANIQAD